MDKIGHKTQIYYKDDKYFKKENEDKTFININNNKYFSFTLKTHDK
jgi:hypothetical protein